MKYKLHDTNTFPLIAFLDDKSLDKINAVFGTHYDKKITNQTTITKEDKEYGFWDRLIRTNRQARVNDIR